MPSALAAPNVNPTSVNGSFTSSSRPTSPPTARKSASMGRSNSNTEPATTSASTSTATATHTATATSTSTSTSTSSTTATLTKTLSLSSSSSPESRSLAHLACDDILFTSTFVRSMTPRSMLVIAQLGLEPDELVNRTYESFYVEGVPPQIQQMRYDHYHKTRKFWLGKARTRRARLLSGDRPTSDTDLSPRSTSTSTSPRRPHTVEPMEFERKRYNKFRTTLSLDAEEQKQHHIPKQQQRPKTSQTHHMDSHPILSSCISPLSPTSCTALDERYANFYTRITNRMESRQQQQLRELVAREDAKIQQEQAYEANRRRREERFKQQRIKAKEEAMQAMIARREKLARVYAAEQQKHLEQESRWHESQARYQANREMQEEERNKKIRDKQRSESARDHAAHERARALFESKHRAMLKQVRILHQRFQRSRERVEEEKAILARQREERTRQIQQRVVQAAQENLEKHQQAWEQYQERTAAHERAISDMIALREENLAQKRQLEAERREEMSQKLQQLSLQHRTKREDVMNKHQHDATRMKEIEEAKRLDEMMLAEKIRLEEQRKQRNLERVARRDAHRAMTLASKIDADLSRIQKIAESRAQYDAKREQVLHKYANDTHAFREQMNRLMIHGTIQQLQMMGQTTTGRMN